MLHLHFLRWVGLVNPCHICRETRAVGVCQVCGTHVCPLHRWSTGDPKDGYYCVDSWCAPKHKSSFSIPPWADERVDPAYSTPEGLLPPLPAPSDLTDRPYTSRRLLILGSTVLGIVVLALLICWVCM